MSVSNFSYINATIRDATAPGRGYIAGPDGKAKKIKAIYVGVNNIARKVTDAYVGVTDKAKRWWPFMKISGPPTTGGPTVPSTGVILSAFTDVGNYGVLFGGHNGTTNISSIRTIDASLSVATTPLTTAALFNRGVLNQASAATFRTRDLAVCAGGNSQAVIDGIDASLTKISLPNVTETYITTCWSHIAFQNSVIFIVNRNTSNNAGAGSANRLLDSGTLSLFPTVNPSVRYTGTAASNKLLFFFGGYSNSYQPTTVAQLYNESFTQVTMPVVWPGINGLSWGSTGSAIDQDNLLIPTQAGVLIMDPALTITSAPVPLNVGNIQQQATLPSCKYVPGRGAFLRLPSTSAYTTSYFIEDGTHMVTTFNDLMPTSNNQYMGFLNIANRYMLNAAEGNSPMHQDIYTYNL